MLLWYRQTVNTTDHVLAEAKLAHVNTNLFEEQADAGEKVTESLVVNDAVLDSLPDGNLLHRGLTRELRISVQEVQLKIFYLVESTMLLAALWVNDWRVD